MNKTDDVMKLVSPGAVLAQIATSIPADCREHLIIIGSLAVGYSTSDTALTAIPGRRNEGACVRFISMYSGF
jgi:hypothetical protein